MRGRYCFLLTRLLKPNTYLLSKSAVFVSKCTNMFFPLLNDNRARKANRFIFIPSKMATLYFMQNGIVNYWCNFYFMLKMITYCTKRIIQNMNSHCHLLKYKYIQQFYLNIFTECSTFFFLLF